MSTRRILAIAMAVLLAGLPTSAAAQQQSVIGSISGSVDAKTMKAGAHAVRLRDVITGQVVKTGTLGPQGQFTFDQLPLGRKYMVELVDTAANKVVATQGPFTLSATASVIKTGVLMSSAASKMPAALWLIAAGAGTAVAVATATESGSR
jgi:hypothetical protein